jgi:uncharacterized protein YrrD
MSRSLRDLLGAPVIASDTAQRLGDLQEVLLAERPDRVVGIRISDATRHHAVVDWQHVELGPDAVMVDHDSHVRTAEAGVEEEAASGHRSLLGATILDTDGASLGVVDDVTIDERSGDIESVRAGATAISRGSLRSLGRYALVVQSGQR